MDVVIQEIALKIITMFEWEIMVLCRINKFLKIKHCIVFSTMSKSLITNFKILLN